jgi:N-acetylglucosaminyldiphosphoundecaprenol N-acetyl-beta-D-mannosaminyltransferase
MSGKPQVDMTSTTLETSEPRRYKLGRFRLDALTRLELLSVFADAIATKKRAIVLHQNLHGLYVQLTDRSVDVIYDKADYVCIDGMPIVWLAKAAGLPVKTVHRNTFIDCFEEVLVLAAQNSWRVFYFGGREEVLRVGLAKLRNLLPSLTIAGHHGHIADDQNRNVADTIIAFRPDILFVGLGMPRQEHWVARYGSRVEAPVIATCGATLEYVSCL